MDHLPPSPWTQYKGHFGFFRKFVEIFASEGAPPVSTTPCGKFATGVNDTGCKFATSTAGVVDTGGRYQWHQWQKMGTISDCWHLKVNLKEKNHLSTTHKQSWAHRSYKLSERSKAMSDRWFSEWKIKSVERWANCQIKEFADRSERSLDLKECAFLSGSLSSDVREKEWTKGTHY